MAGGGGGAFIKRVVMERKFLSSFPIPSGPVNAAFLVDGFGGAREAVSRKHQFCRSSRIACRRFLLVQLGWFIMGPEWLL